MLEVAIPAVAMSGFIDVAIQRSKQQFARGQSTEKDIQVNEKKAHQESNQERVVSTKTTGRVARPEKTPWLIRALLAKAASRQETLRDVSEKLGVSFGYIQQLQFGMRKVEFISRDFSEMVAVYLEIPTILVWVLAGRVTAQDFVWPTTLQNDLDAELAAMRLDERLGALAPDALQSADSSVKRFLLLLYKEAKSEMQQRERRLPLVLDEMLHATLQMEEALAG